MRAAWVTSRPALRPTRRDHGLVPQHGLILRVRLAFLLELSLNAGSDVIGCVFAHFHSNCHRKQSGVRQNDGTALV